tara:strand:+ start:223 stop:495 length:273 start_codon:yes stop_codon:yes gene_type:complete
MKEEFKKLSILLESIINSNKLEVDLDKQSEFNEVVQKIKILKENTSENDIKNSIDFDYLEELVAKIEEKQKKNFKVLEEFKNYIEKKKKF